MMSSRYRRRTQKRKTRRRPREWEGVAEMAQTMTPLPLAVRLPERSILCRHAKK